MKKLTLLALILAAGTLAGCSSTDYACGCVKGNCCDWSFYQPCDLIEGRRADCGNPQCYPGIEGTVVEICPPPDATEPAEAPAEEPAAPAEPAEPAEGDAGEPVSDFGLPPAGK